MWLPCRCRIHGAVRSVVGLRVNRCVGSEGDVVLRPVYLVPAGAQRDRDGCHIPVAPRCRPNVDSNTGRVCRGGPEPQCSRGRKCP
jgi:hypothetical protein